MEPRSHLSAYSRSCVLVLALLYSAFAGPAAGATLESVLAKMDETSKGFHSAQANFTWTVFNQVINDVAEKESGKIYFRRTQHDSQLYADITEPEPRQILFSQGKIEVYQKKIETVDEIDASAHKDEFETFLVLGFGSSGDSLKKSFDVKDLGQETVDRCQAGCPIQAAKLELTPLSDRIRQQFPKIVLWIDPETGLSVEQKLIEANGDYRLAKYFDIRCCSQKLGDSVFHLKTTAKTKTVKH